MPNPDRPTRPFFETVDTLLCAVPWTRRRMVLIFRREHGARAYIQLRTFNRHQIKGCWYPSRRCYMVPMECVRSLGQALLAAADGRPYGKEPEWYRDFEKQYLGLCKRKAASADVRGSRSDDEAYDATDDEAAIPTLGGGSPGGE